MSFQQKYLKYKSKYLLLKNQIGGNPQEILKILVSRKDPNILAKINLNHTIDAQYLENYKYLEKNWTVLDNQLFIDWCNLLVGGTAIDERFVSETCEQLWPLFLAHFEELASYDMAPNWAYEKSDQTKLLRRFKDYFPNEGIGLHSKPNITNEELKEIFHKKFQKAVGDIIGFLKPDKVMECFPLHYLFYQTFRFE
jgi:hypothetical protein